MTAYRLPARGDLLAAGAGVFLTFGAMLAVQRNGAGATLVLMFGAGAFATFIAGFAFAPHIFVSLAVAYFAFLPAIERFLPTGLGGTKDVVTLAAGCATVGLLLRRRTLRLGTPDVLLLGLLLGLYVVNIGGALTGETGHGVAWFHGVRLFMEPLILFVFGTSVRFPHRTLRWVVATLTVVCVANALFGLLQQALGTNGLLNIGYTYGAEVREISGHVRSFGTMAEPFSYAAFLLLGAAALLVWYRRNPLVVLALAIVAVGLVASYVRTAALIAAALLAIAATQRGYGRFALPLLLAAVAAAGILFASASRETATRSVQVNPTTYLTLNGRTNIWTSTLNSSADWMFGRGVGAAGTASQRATRGLSSRAPNRVKGGSIVDSSYFAVIADIGIVGLGLFLAFFARVFQQARLAAKRKRASGWLALALLTVTLLDAVTRESFTGFPTAYVSLLVIGVAWATWHEEPEAELARA
jgi:O-antigen ligase